MKFTLAAPGPGTLGSYSSYATLALGSALALFLYPHSLTGILSSSSQQVIRRNAALLPAYSVALGILALFGFMALALHVGGRPELAWTLQFKAAIYTVSIFGFSVPGYIALYALAANLVVSLVLSALWKRFATRSATGQFILRAEAQS
jgi:SSS family solute:Na+ symporter